MKGDSTSTAAIYSAIRPRRTCGNPAKFCWQQLYDRRHDFGAVLHHIAGRFAGLRHCNDVAYAFQQRIDPQEQQFVAFTAFEWSKAGAHRHVVYRDWITTPGFSDREYRGEEQPPPQLATDLKSFTRPLKTAESRPPQVLAIAHHTLMNRPDWPQEPFDWGPALDDPVQRLVEIYSRHGSSELCTDQVSIADYTIKQGLMWQRRGHRASAQDALQLGYRLGFIGGSDNHAYGLEQAREQEGPSSYSRGGLAMALAIRGPESRRDRIFDALYERRCYGTTGARILLQVVTPQGITMGQQTDEAGPVTLHVSAVAAGHAPSVRLQSVELFRDGSELVSRHELNTVQCAITVTDEAPLRDGSMHSYYVRVQQTDGHRAWSSPIWWRTKKTEEP